MASRTLQRLILGVAVASTACVGWAQQQPVAPTAFDPSVLLADTRALLHRAPDREIDGLFQAMHAAMQSPTDADVLCALLDPQADRSLAGINATAAQLSEASQVRFAGALTEMLIAAAQQPPRTFDAEAARQALRSAGVVATMLNDGFVEGLDGDDRNARCRSMNMLLDAVQTRPLPERAAITRLLLDEGLMQFASGMREARIGQP